MKASNNTQDRKDSTGKRKSGPLITEDTDDDENDENSYLATGNRYASAVQDSTAKTLRKAYSSEASLYAKMTSGAISLVQPPVPSPNKPDAGAMGSPSKLNANPSTSESKEKFDLITPHWLEPPDSPFRDDSTFYATFLNSIVNQTGGCEGNEIGECKIPIELAATKLMILNGTNAKKF